MIGVVIFSFTTARSTLANFSPVRCDHQCLRTLDCFRGQNRQIFAFAIDFTSRAFFHSLSDRKLRRAHLPRSISATNSMATEEPDVIRIRFKGRVPRPRSFLSRKTQSASRTALRKRSFCVAVDSLDFFQQVERNAELFADRDKGGDVFRKTGTAVADPSV